MVYLHGSSGLNVPELAWARRFSDAGFIVVAGCYLGVDPAVVESGAVASGYRARGFRTRSRPTPRPCCGHTTRCCTTAAALPDAKPGALGVVGVSYGGILALSTPEAAVKVIVADSGYGKAGAAPVTAPVLLLGMDSDPNVAHMNVTGFEQLLRAAQKTVESHYYAGSGHVATLTFGVPGVAGDATQARGDVPADLPGVSARGENVIEDPPFASRAGRSTVATRATRSRAAACTTSAVVCATRKYSRKR